MNGGMGSQESYQTLVVLLHHSRGGGGGGGGRLVLLARPMLAFCFRGLTFPVTSVLEKGKRACMGLASKTRERCVLVLMLLE